MFVDVSVCVQRGRKSLLECALVRKGKVGSNGEEDESNPATQFYKQAPRNPAQAGSIIKVLRRVCMSANEL